MNAPPNAPRARTLAPLAAFALIAFGRTASADEKADCLAAASTGQTLRDSHALIEAKGQFQLCARPSCPALVQTDCGDWLAAVDRALPSVVLNAKDGDGRDLFDVSVTVDGKPLTQKLEGQALAMNPGAHEFRFALANGTTATSQVLVREGEKAQEVAVVLPAAAFPTLEPGPTPLPVEPPKPVVTGPSPALQHALGLVLGGLGIAGVGIGGGIALDAKSKDDAASRETGAPRHTDSLNAVSEGNAGTIVMVTGGVLVAAGVVVWFTAPKARVSVGTNGSEVLLRGRF